ncbi:amidohydrolase family protein [Nocardia alni]|uniref:amidohydrolase family protein n=1 Tax=Nocardia alni TaxID=2815723 RepID=UPI001C20F811|nr:amidohydrolase family protein [Nocardia alni]
MIIDSHGRFTTAPRALGKWRERQIRAFESSRFRVLPNEFIVDDDEEIVAAIERGGHGRGIDLTLLSLGPDTFGHSGDEITNLQWAEVSNELISRVCGLFPGRFAGVCRLPQTSGDALESSIRRSAEELERCVTELEFVGCLLEPDLSDGSRQAPPPTDEVYYPLYEKMVELDVPATVLGDDAAALAQLRGSTLFADFPALRLILPHGGGMPSQGRPLGEALPRNVFFGTGVQDKREMELLIDIVPAENVLLVSDMADTGGADRRVDDAKAILDSIDSISDHDRSAIYGANALRVFPRLDRLPRNGIDELARTAHGQDL